MHTQNNGTAAKHGLIDPDRGSKQHDLACQFIMSRAKELADLLIGTREAEVGLTEDGVEVSLLPRVLTRSEVLLEKLSGRFRKEPNYIDVVIATYTEERANSLVSRLGRKVDLIVEIKTGSAPVIGEALRQLKGYAYWYNNSTMGPPEDGHNVDGWHRTPLVKALVLATTCLLSSRDNEALKREGVRYVHLGRDFMDWSRAKTAAGLPDISW